MKTLWEGMIEEIDETLESLSKIKSRDSASKRRDATVKHLQGLRRTAVEKHKEDKCQTIV